MWPFIVGDVKNTLKSVANTCDSGDNVLFTKLAGYIINLETGNVIEIDREGNNYVIQNDDGQYNTIHL